MLASLSVDRYRQDRSLDQLAHELAVASDAGLPAPEVSRVRLPSGPVVRVR